MSGGGEGVEALKVQYEQRPGCPKAGFTFILSHREQETFRPTEMKASGESSVLWLLGAD